MTSLETSCTSLLSPHEAYAELEQAYEELHSKFEKLWEERSVARHLSATMRRERDLLVAAVAGKGISVPEALRQISSVGDMSDNDTDCSFNEDGLEEDSINSGDE